MLLRRVVSRGCVVVSYSGSFRVRDYAGYYKTRETMLRLSIRNELGSTGPSTEITKSRSQQSPSRRQKRIRQSSHFPPPKLPNQTISHYCPSFLITQPPLFSLPISSFPPLVFPGVSTRLVIMTNPTSQNQTQTKPNPKLSIYLN